MKSLNESQTTIDEEDHIIDTVELKRLFSGVAASFFTGGCLGSIAGVWCRDRYSSKNLLIYCYTIFIAAAPLLHNCENFELFPLLLAGRFVAGIASGLATAIVTMYLSKIAPQEFYGTLTAFTLLGVSGGIVIAQTMTLPEFLGTKTTWGLAYSVYVFANIGGLLLLPFSSECPDYLYVIAGRRDNAQNVLRRLRGNDNERINRELNALQRQAVRRAKLRSFCSVLMDPKLLGKLVGTVVFYLLQFVLWAINAVAFYSSNLMFKQVLENAVISRRIAWHDGWHQFGLNVLVVLIVHAHRSIRRCFRSRFGFLVLFAATLITPFVSTWNYYDTMGHVSGAMPFVVIINILPMALRSFFYYLPCANAKALPRLNPITSSFFLFCIGLSFVSMHSFVGSDDLWLWTIYFFGYFALYFAFVFLRQRRYLPKKKKRPSNVTNEKSTTPVSKFISIKFDRRWISYKLRVDN